MQASIAIDLSPIAADRFSSTQMKVRYLRIVRKAFRALRHPQLRHRPWWQKISKPLFERSLWVPCRDSVALAVTIGIFFSMMLMPMQMLPAAILAMLLRANVPTAMATCWVTNPVTMGPVVYGQGVFGKWLRESCLLPMPEFLAKVQYEIPGVGVINAANFTLGMFASGIILAALAYPTVMLIAKIIPHHLPVNRKRIGFSYFFLGLMKKSPK